MERRKKEEKEEKRKARKERGREGERNRRKIYKEHPMSLNPFFKTVAPLPIRVCLNEHLLSTDKACTSTRDEKLPCLVPQGEPDVKLIYQNPSSS